MDLHELFLRHPAVYITFAAMLGLVWGSFLNVVSLRLPRRLDWERARERVGRLEDTEVEYPPPSLLPSSRCPKCGHSLAIWENIPVVSYLLLRGRCHECLEEISLRYPMVELLAGILTVIVAWRFGVSWQTAALLPFTWALVVLALIDYDHNYLPGIIVYPFLWGGLFLSQFEILVTPAASIQGAVVGYLSLWVTIQLFRLVSTPDITWRDDPKLLALFGAWVGLHGLFQILAVSLALLLISRIPSSLHREWIALEQLPFRLWLTISGWVTILVGVYFDPAF